VEAQLLIMMVEGGSGDVLFVLNVPKLDIRAAFEHA
jgi:hypothetical protein